MVEFDDTVVAIGGYKNLIGYSDRLYKLSCTEGSPCEWIEMRQKLKVARHYFVAIMIPNELTECVKNP